MNKAEPQLKGLGALPTSSEEDSELSWQINLLENQIAELQAKKRELEDHKKSVTETISKTAEMYKQIPKEDHALLSAASARAEAELKAVRERLNELQNTLAAAEREEASSKSELNKLNRELEIS